MAKKRTRHQNPEPFLANDTKSVSQKLTKRPKQLQREDKLISSGMSYKILKEALIQHKEIQDEVEARNPSAFVFAEELANEGESDVDEFDGFSETHSQFGGYEHEEIDEADERLLEAFMSKDASRQRTLADIVVGKIKEKDAQFSLGLMSSSIVETLPLPKLDDSFIDIYKGVGKLLNNYMSGKLPKAFKCIPSSQFWEEVLYLTEPEKWSPNSMFQATRIFASNLGVKKAERFYKLVLLPRVREDIRKNKRLHVALYQALKKSLYKPAAFNKGILLPLCESRTCKLREAVIIGSVVHNVSIPRPHSSVALLKLAEMEYCGTTSYFIKLLIEKKYALPYRVVDAMVVHFMNFIEESRIMPVIWQQSLLAFVQRYKNKLRKEDKVNLKTLVEKQRHKLVTPEILRELKNSRNCGEKDDDLMSMSSPKSKFDEDRFDIPDVPMEED